MIVIAEGWAQANMHCLYNFWAETVAEETDASFPIHINLIQSNHTGFYISLAKLTHN